MQIGGNHQDLLEHIQDVRLCPEFGDDIDMKLARSAGAESAQAITQSHFDSIHVSICKVRTNVPDPKQQTFPQFRRQCMPGRDSMQEMGAENYGRRYLEQLQVKDVTENALRRGNPVRLLV